MTERVLSLLDQPPDDGQPAGERAAAVAGGVASAA